MLPRRAKIFSSGSSKIALSATEVFGIAHPDQILSFPRAFNPATQKLKVGGTEVAYQPDGSNTLVRMTGGIAANGTKVWTIAPGARAAAAQITVTNDGTNYTIDNTLTAVRIPMVIACGTGSNSPIFTDYAPGIVPPGEFPKITAKSAVLAPIQGVRHRDGTWTGVGPNYIYLSYTMHTTAAGGWTDQVLQGAAPCNWPATSTTVTVLENGPLRAKIKVAYIGLRHGWRPPPGDPGIASSFTGFLNCTITMEAGQPVFMVEHESDTTFFWQVDMNTGVNANRARWRGHHSSSIANGHNLDGTLRGDMNSGDLDAELNLDVGGTRNNWNYSFDITPWDGVWSPAVSPWQQWLGDTGWYWHAYNSTGGTNSNMWGIIQGPAGLFIGAEASFGCGAWGTPAAGVPTAYGFFMWLSRNTQSPLSTSLSHKISYGIFLGSKGADVPVDFTASYVTGAPNVFTYSVTNPTICKVMNTHSGTAQFSKQISQGLSFPDPPGGFPGMYLSRADTEALITAISSDPGGQSGGGFYGTIFNKDVRYRDLWDAFHDTTNATASTMVTNLLNEINYALNVYVNIGSIESAPWTYWVGGTQFQAMMVYVQAMISLHQLRPFLTPTQWIQLKSTISMIGFIMWDEDFTPMENSSMFSMGTGNMPVQYNAMRNEVALLLTTHPQFTARASSVVGFAQYGYGASVDSYGTVKDSPHYAGALLVPSMDTLRQLQVAGVADMFATGSSIYAQLTVTAEWLMQILTPKQSRFGNLRKTVCYADAYAEGHDMFLTMVMGFEASNPTLAKRMAGSWADMGQPVSSFYNCSSMKIRPGFPAQDAALGDADFPGSFTVMRSAWGTANESAVFLHHGDNNSDHAASFQRGTPNIYLLGAPITTCYGGYGGTYHLVGPWVSCSTYIPVSELGWDVGHTTQEPGAWNTYTDLNLPCGIFSGLLQDTYTYTSTTNRVDLTCTFAVAAGWIRKLTYYRDDLTCPVVRLRDSNTAIGNSIFTLHMLATGAVTLPDNSTFTPAIVNFPTVTLDTGTFLPGTPFAIANGACFQFTGQSGISWDLYYFGPAAQAFIGSFTNTNNDPGAGEYQAATGQQYREMMYILRINTAGPCDVVMVPYTTAVLVPSSPTVLLTHMDGANNSTTFTDATGLHTITPVNSPKINTAQSKFGGASVRVTRTSPTLGDYLTLGGSSDFAFHLGDFTVDFWVRFATVPTGGNQMVMFSLTGANPYGIIYVTPTGVFSVYLLITGTTVPVINTWYHVALTRAGGVSRLFINGIQEGGNATDTSNYVSFTNFPYIASNITAGADCLDGWIDELRVIKGVAAWTANFTPPTSAYTEGTVTFTTTGGRPSGLTVTQISGGLQLNPGARTLAN